MRWRRRLLLIFELGGRGSRRGRGLGEGEGEVGGVEDAFFRLRKGWDEMRRMGTNDRMRYALYDMTRFHLGR